MIRVSEVKDIEKLLKDSCFTNEIHKERLWERLQRDNVFVKAAVVNYPPLNSLTRI